MRPKRGPSKRLEYRREALERNNFKISRTKTKPLICNFVSKIQDDIEVPKYEAFSYLESIIQKNGGI